MQKPFRNRNWEHLGGKKTWGSQILFFFFKYRYPFMFVNMFAYHSSLGFPTVRVVLKAELLILHSVLLLALSVEVGPL